MNITADETELRVHRLTGTLIHAVPGLELVFLLGGAARIEAGGAEIHRLSEGDILLLERRERIRIRPVNAAGTNAAIECFLLVLRIGKNFLSQAFPDGVPDFFCDSTSALYPDCIVLKKNPRGNCLRRKHRRAVTGWGGGGGGLIRTIVIFPDSRPPL
jgi:hypothetical protein